MKSNNIIKLVLTGLVITALSACKKDFQKINTDPNNPTEVPTSYLLTGAEKGLMDNTSDYDWGGADGNQLAQYWASNQYAEESRYQFRANVTSSHWNLFYAGGSNAPGVEVGGLAELQNIIDLCKTEPGKYGAYGNIKNQLAVANILQVWAFQNITDVWGDVPYSEALKGIKIPSPKYDRQQDVYHGLIAQLDSANAWIDPAQAGPLGDVIYGGDMNKWKKFCNSLMLRVSIRIADREPALASQKIAAAVAAGVFTTNADNAALLYMNSAPNTNPVFYANNDLHRFDYCASSTMTDVLSALNDPRLHAFYDPAADTNAYIGRPYGQDDGTASLTPASSVSQPSAFVSSADFPGVFMDISEVNFILAEAIERGISIPGAADQYYHDAILASFDAWRLPPPPPNYFSDPAVNYNAVKSAVGYKKAIGKQKWIALYMHGMEGWIEWRRLDFGILQMPASGPIPPATDIPVRMLYPVDEQVVNTANYGAAIGVQGPDRQETKVWWDVN